MAVLRGRAQHARSFLLHVAVGDGKQLSFVVNSIEADFPGKDRRRSFARHPK